MPDQTFPSLAGQALIAMPTIGDSRFQRTVIYLCMHDANGAMGLVVNKPDPKRSIADIMRELDLLPGEETEQPDTLSAPLLLGGPVEKSRGFLLHAPSGVTREGTVKVADGVELSTTLDTLREIGSGQGPERFLLAVGFASWTAGQLDTEILNNVWLNAEMSADELFTTPAPLLYAASLSGLGVDLHQLSPTAGRG
ncbi:MAG: YqgE/AlgH family protein [Pseudomonadota bacterium]